MAIVLPVLCECGFQYHGERPAAAFTAHNKESACFFLHATDFFFYVYATSLRRQNILKELYIFTFRLWFCV